MEIRNRLFPYPVLCLENDDYIGCEFRVSVNNTEEFNDIVLKFEIYLDNEELLALIRDGKAEYVIHVECSNTSFRTVIRKSGNKFDYSIPKAKVNKDVFLVGMIVAKHQIKGFYSEKFNDDYEEPIDFEKGAILAYRNLPRIIVLKQYEEFASDDAFFTVVSKNSGQAMEEPVTFNLTGDKIKIYVDESIYYEYVKFHTNTNMKDLMITMLVMPALAYVIEEIRNNEIGAYVSYYWYQKIKKYCELQVPGTRFVEDIIEGDETSIEIAQKMLKLPIGKAFKNLSTVVEE